MCGQRKGSHSSFPAAGPAARAAIHQRHRKEVSHVQMHPYAASRVVRERQRDMQAQAQRQRQARQVMAQARESRRARAAPAPRRQSMATGRFAVREPFRWPPRLSARDRSRRSSPTAAPPTAWVSSPGRDARRTAGPVANRSGSRRWTKCPPPAHSSIWTIRQAAEPLASIMVAPWASMEYATLCAKVCAWATCAVRHGWAAGRPAGSMARASADLPANACPDGTEADDGPAG